MWQRLSHLTLYMYTCIYIYIYTVHTVYTAYCHLTGSDACSRVPVHEQSHIHCIVHYLHIIGLTGGTNRMDLHKLKPLHHHHIRQTGKTQNKKI